MVRWPCCSNEGFKKYHEDRQSTFCLQINPNGPTLPVQVFRWPKKYLLLIKHSRPSRDSQEPKTKQKIQFSKALFQKISFCIFFCINPGFGGPWDKLWIFFLIAIFILLQKNAFGQKNQMALLNLCMKSDFFWPKAFF